MNKLLKIALCTVLGLGALAGSVRADTITNGYDRVDSVFYQVFTETAAALSNDVVIDLDALKVNRANFQTNYATANVTAVTFTDSVKSTASLTVSSNTALSTAAASVVLKLVSVSSNVNTSWIALYGVNYATLTFRANFDWTYTAFSTQNVVNAATAINASSNTLGIVATTSQSTMTLTAITPGTGGNAMRVAVSTVAWQIQSAPTSLSANFAGGRDAAFFKIGPYTFTNGIDWNTSTDGTSSTTAKNIATAIGLRAQLSGVLTSTWAANGIVYATASAAGVVPPNIFTSTNAALGVATASATYSNGSALGYFFGTATADISTTTSIITKSNTFTRGLAVLLTVGAGTAPSPLSAGTTYFVTNVATATPASPRSGQFQLSFTSTGAAAGLAIPITSITGSGSFTLTPCAFTGTAGIRFEVSNDSSTWVQVGSSFTITSASVSSTTWHDFGTVNYRYIRSRFAASTFGGVILNMFFNGRN